MGMQGQDHEEQIKARAYQIWEEEGRPEGRDREHWDQATREIMGDAGTGQSPPSTGRDFGDSAGYGEGGSTRDRHEVGDADLDQDRKPNPLDDVVAPERQP
jgi:hypothetical protein